MENQKEKIMRFSKIIHILLKIAFIALIVVGASEAFSWLWSILKLHTEVLTIAGVETELPLLFKFGDFKVYLPIMWAGGFDFLGVRSIPAIGFGDFLQTIFTIVGLGFAKTVFKQLQEDGTPFRDDVVLSLKKLAIALLCMGAVSGVIPFLAAGIVWVLCLIFDYGHTLQNDHDTTL